MQVPYTEAELKAKRCRSVMEASRKGLTIAVQCRDNGCGHRRVVEIEPLIRLGAVRRWEDEFNHIGNRLRCGKRGAKFSHMTGSIEPESSPPIGPANEREFMRMVREQR